MQQSDYEYRNTHGVIPQLDFVNFKNCYENITETQVQFSKAALSTSVKPQGKKILGGAFGLLEASVHMAGGNFGYGIGKLINSTVNIGSGIADPSYLGTGSSINDIIQECEKTAWKFLCFLREFIPASGNIGDIVFKDGSCDEFHCGNGHRFFENGDYFEGLFEDGDIRNGLYIFANGVRYLGAFDDNKNMCGFGTLLYPNGAYYHGELLNSNRHGTGCMWYTDGIYFGNWSDNMRHGNGFFKDLNGKFNDGEWVNDEFIG